MAEAHAAFLAIRCLEVVADRAIRRERVFRDRENPFELDDYDFQKLFRLPRQLIQNLIEDLRPFLLPATRRSAISIETRVLLAVRFFAGGDYQRGVGQEVNVCLSQPSVSKCVTSVSKAMSRHLLQRLIKFPQSEAELTAVKRGFMTKFKFPGVIGAIDCTHVLIVTPSTTAEYEEVVFVNRKGKHSINVQMVCDSRMRILNLNAKYPGSSHDSYIWSNCALRTLLMQGHENGTMKNTWLIGDKGYPLEPWLMTPIPETADITAGERRYNIVLSRSRYIVECQYGLFKQVWRCVGKDRVLHYKPSTAGDIIVSCAILHNQFVHYNLPFPELEEEDDPEDSDLEDEIPQVRVRRGNPLATEGHSLQMRIIRNNFDTVT